MAKDCHDRRLTAGEKEQWGHAIKYLKWAIWLDLDLEYGLQDLYSGASTRLLNELAIPADLRYEKENVERLTEFFHNLSHRCSILLAI